MVESASIIQYLIIISPTRLWQPVNNLAASWKLGCHNLVGHITRYCIMVGWLYHRVPLISPPSILFAPTQTKTFHLAYKRVFLQSFDMNMHEAILLDGSMIFINCLTRFMLSQSLAQVPVKYVSVQCKGAYSRYSTVYYYPCPRGRRVQYLVCVCVCVCVCLSVCYQLSLNLNKLQVTNLVIWDKKWISTRQASSCRQAWLK